MNILIAITQALLIFCVFAIVALSYWAGLRRGVDIIARVELNEAQPDALNVPDVWRDYVRERRETVMEYDNEAAYHLWRRANKLPDGIAARELFKDKSYRDALRSQIDYERNNN